jgi:hypothetical protein
MPEVRCKVIKEARIQNRSLRKSYVDRSKLGPKPLVDASSSSPPEVGEKPPHIVVVKRGP